MGATPMWVHTRRPVCPNALETVGAAFSSALRWQRPIEDAPIPYTKVVMFTVLEQFRAVNTLRHIANKIRRTVEGCEAAENYRCIPHRQHRKLDTFLSRRVDICYLTREAHIFCAKPWDIRTECSSQPPISYHVLGVVVKAAYLPLHPEHYPAPLSHMTAIERHAYSPISSAHVIGSLSHNAQYNLTDGLVRGNVDICARAAPVVGAGQQS